MNEVRENFQNCVVKKETRKKVFHNLQQSLTSFTNNSRGEKNLLRISIVSSSLHFHIAIPVNINFSCFAYTKSHNDDILPHQTFTTMFPPEDKCWRKLYRRSGKKIMPFSIWIIKNIKEMKNYTSTKNVENCKLWDG